MRGGTAVVLLALASAVVAQAADSVLTAVGTNFDSIIQKNDFVVMEFYASWCGHCKKLAPEYEKAAQALDNTDPPIVLAKMEATEEGNKEVAARYGVQGYPTIKVGPLHFMAWSAQQPSLFDEFRWCSGVQRGGP